MNGKQSEKKAQIDGREGSNPLIWSPTAAAVNSTLLKHALTHAPTPKKTKKKRKKAQKQGREGSNPLIWRPSSVNSTRCKLILTVLL